MQNKIWNEWKKTILEKDLMNKNYIVDLIEELLEYGLYLIKVKDLDGEGYINPFTMRFNESSNLENNDYVIIYPEEDESYNRVEKILLDNRTKVLKKEIFNNGYTIIEIISSDYASVVATGCDYDLLVHLGSVQHQLFWYKMIEKK